MKTSIITAVWQNWLPFFGGVFTGLLLLVSTTQAETTLKVYSDRIDQLIAPSFDAFEETTGIRIKFTTAKSGVLIERLQNEGKGTLADMLITTDAGNLWKAKKQGLLAVIQDQQLNANVPAHLRDKDGMWYGLTQRARTIIYSPHRVKPSELSSYAALGDPKWKDRLCLRTAKKIYNKSLVASMIAHYGIKDTEVIVGGWVQNNAKIQPKDSSVIKAIAAGDCDVGIVNTYYLGRELKKRPDFPVALFWANQGKYGVHVNVSGAGVTKHSKNKKAAVQLLRFLSSEGQNLFVDDNMEYPVNAKIPPSALLTQWWGDFKADTLNLDKLGEHQAEAVKLMDRVGYK